jgi:hypothetical protein
MSKESARLLLRWTVLTDGKRLCTVLSVTDHVEVLHDDGSHEHIQFDKMTDWHIF